MSILNFFKQSQDNTNILYVVDRLLDFAVRDGEKVTVTIILQTHES